MLQFDEIRLQLENLKPGLDNLKAALAPEKMKEEIAALEEKQAAPDFWEDPQSSQKVLKRASLLKNKLEAVSYTHLDVYKRQVRDGSPAFHGRKIICVKKLL